MVKPRGCKYWQRGSAYVIYFLVHSRPEFVFVDVLLLFFSSSQSALESKSAVPAAYGESRPPLQAAPGCVHCPISGMTR